LRPYFARPDFKRFLSKQEKGIAIDQVWTQWESDIEQLSLERDRLLDMIEALPVVSS
jgi:hypothetical protein